MVHSLSIIAIIQTELLGSMSRVIGTIYINDDLTSLLFQLLYITVYKPLTHLVDQTPIGLVFKST